MNIENFQPARGGESEFPVTPPSVPPLYQTTAFDIADLNQLQQIHAGEVSGHIYTRDGNPNHQMFASAVAHMEGAEAAVVAASGMGSLAAVFLSMLRSGDHVICARVLYGKSLQLLTELSERFGIEVTFVDATKPEEFANARRPNSKLAVVETLSNPLLEVANLPAIVGALQNVPLLVDSTFTTPELIRPLQHGAAIVFHSVTKYLNGHGDVTLGVLAGSKELVEPIAKNTSLYGINGNPFGCWLALRGLRTLPLRMKQVSQSAQRIAEFLAAHPRVEKVHYPGLKSHPDWSLAQTLMPHGFGGMLSFELRDGDRALVSKFMQLARTLPFSPTLADARTTLSWPAGTSHVHLTDEERNALGVKPGLVRLSTGLESTDVLIQELETALNSL